MRQDGFTLVELVMIMLVVGVLAVYAAPRLDQSGQDVTAARRDLVEAIRYAQEMAMSHTGDNSYQITIDGSGADGSFTVNGTNVINPASGGAYTADPDVWSGIALSPAGPTTIRFNGRGAPNLAATTTFTLTSGGESRTVTVEKSTGYLH